MSTRLLLAVNADGERFVDEIPETRNAPPRMVAHRGRAYTVIMTMAPAHREWALAWYREAAPNGTAKMSVSAA